MFLKIIIFIALLVQVSSVYAQSDIKILEKEIVAQEDTIKEIGRAHV